MRTYGLRIPVCRGSGRKRCWQLLQRLWAMRIPDKWLALVPPQIRAFVLRIDCVGGRPAKWCVLECEYRRFWSLARVPDLEETELCLQPLTSLSTLAWM